MKVNALLACALFACQSLGKGGEKIHLQWAICDRDAKTVLKKLGEDARDPYKENPITYFDTFPPTHARQGVMFRTKVNKGEPFSLIKVRFNDKPEYNHLAAACVWDRYGDNIFYTCGQKYSLSSGTKRIWSDDQVRFAERFDDNIDWDGLVPYGPFPDGKWKLRILGHKAKLDDVVAGDLHLMEIEMEFPKSKSGDAFRDITDYLIERRVVLCDHQSPKTLRLFHSMGYIEGDEKPQEEL